MKDTLGDRMKNYEVRSRTSLPRRTYAIIRIDGKAFHTYTKGLKRPFDEFLASDMDETTKYLCKNIQGAKFGYVQSDEISILLTDFEQVDTQAWFDYEVQKMVSISASMATAIFNDLRRKRGYEKLAMFDARVFAITDPFEVANYFVWRQQDATRNSISMAAQHYCGHKATMHKSSNQKQEMIFQTANVNWNDFTERFKRGGLFKKNQVEKESGVVRSVWENSGTPVFTKQPGFLYKQIPVISGSGDVFSLREMYNRTATPDMTSQICDLCEVKTGPDHHGGCDQLNNEKCIWHVKTVEQTTRT